MWLLSSVWAVFWGNQLPNGFEQLLGGAALYQESVGAGRQGGGPLGRVHRQHDDLERRLLLFQEPGGLQPAHNWHLGIHQHQVRPAFRGETDGILPVVGLGNNLEVRPGGQQGS